MMEPGYGYHAERVEQLEPIVRALAATEPGNTVPMHRCPFCRRENIMGPRHEDGCPWVAAREWMEANPQ